MVRVSVNARARVWFRVTINARARARVSVRAGAKAWTTFRV